MTETALQNPPEARQSDPPLRVTLSAELAARVRSARTDARMTQATLAEACGLERTSVTMLEKGRSLPPLDVLYRMAAALKMEPEELLGCTPAARPCCGNWSSCTVPCVPRANHWQAEAHRMTDRVHELQGLIAQRALEELREQERRHGAGG